jgi:ketosteroid isomerase-like protein
MAAGGASVSGHTQSG